METIFKKETSRFTLELSIKHLGKDLCITLSGGDNPHIGAVALAIPHCALQNPKIKDASVSVLTVTGHKEDELARSIAQKFSTTCCCTVSVSCGIHLDGASKKEITDVLKSSEELIETSLSHLKSS